MALGVTAAALVMPTIVLDTTIPEPTMIRNFADHSANERTFLAWSRTALALVVAGLGIIQLLPPFPGVPVGRHLLGVPLIALGAVSALVAYAEWERNQRALKDLCEGCLEGGRLFASVRH